MKLAAALVPFLQLPGNAQMAALGEVNVSALGYDVSVGLVLKNSAINCASLQEQIGGPCL